MTDDQKRIQDIGHELVATLLRKNTDYGSSAFDAPCLIPKMDPGAAILVRMSDKIARIRRLIDHAAETDEPLDDSVRDLAGYCILYLTHRARSTHETKRV